MTCPTKTTATIAAAATAIAKTWRRSEDGEELGMACSCSVMRPAAHMPPLLYRSLREIPHKATKSELVLMLDFGRGGEGNRCAFERRAC